MKPILLRLALALAGFFGSQAMANAQPEPWDEGGRPAIYDFLLERGEPGRVLPEEAMTLPDDEVFNRGKTVRWAPGGLDGAFGHHGAAAGGEGAGVVFAALKVAVEEPTPEHHRALYELLLPDETISFIDELLSLILEDSELDGEGLLILARQLATRSPDRGPVKVGIAVLGLAAQSADREVLMTLGRHDEFTLYASVALSNTVPDPESALWELAQQVEGWGRIQTVERLAGTQDPAIKAWMLREGYENSVMYEYLAYICATTGDLRSALGNAEPDDALLQGAGDIIRALISGGPAQSMDDYEAGAEVTRLYVEHASRRPADDLDRYLVLRGIKAFVDDDDADWEYRLTLGWTAETRRQISDAAAQILARDEWKVRVREALQAADEITYREAAYVAEDLGWDIWETRFDRQRFGQSEEWYFLMQTEDPARIDRTITLAMDRLDLRKIASGPGLESGLGLEYRQHAALDFILQGLGHFPGKGWRLVEAGLRSPVIRNRHLALKVLSVWTESNWPAEARAALEKALTIEPDGEVKQRIRWVLEGRSLE